MIGYNYREKNSSIKFHLLDLIRAGKLPTNGKPNKLPSENELVGILDASLLTVREALKSLEFEGFISKRHGTGNFYHQSVLDLKLRIDLIADFTHLLEDAGYKVTTFQSPHVVRTASKREVEAFGIAQQEKFICFNRTYSVDGRTAIRMELLTPLSILTIDREGIEAITTVEELLWTHGREKIVNSIETLVPRDTTKEEIKAFGLARKCPMICINHTFYSISDKIVGYAVSAFNPEIMKMNLIRKWY